ncbi:MAG: hypothetical protein AOA65_1321 [Candidatus Bathyarchaeota archaeon BA1]|nr:MAG: hypothetical protein AOA65_1321 [Candidatus Bathyarchaeota archaeon BA1]
MNKGVCVKVLAIATVALLVCASLPTIVLAEPASAKSPLIIPIGGTLAPGETHLWGLGYLLEGSLVTVRLYWSPGSATLELAMALYYPPYIILYDQKPVVGGSIVQSWTVRFSENWYFYIRNKSTTTVTYNGYIQIIYASSVPRGC